MIIFLNFCQGIIHSSNVMVCVITKNTALLPFKLQDDIIRKSYRVLYPLTNLIVIMSSENLQSCNKILKKIIKFYKG